MKYILILILSINTCFSIDITPIKKGEAAPNNGFFITKQEIKKLRKINETKKLLEKENLKLQDLRVVKQERIKIYQESLLAINKKLRWEQTKGHFKTIGGFLVGFLATSLVTYATLKYTRK